MNRYFHKLVATHSLTNITISNTHSIIKEWKLCDKSHSKYIFTLNLCYPCSASIIIYWVLILDRC